MNDFFFWKWAIAVAMVLLMTYVAETAGSKWAGIIGGLPTGSALSLYFIALENGTEFASISALYNAIGLIAMQAFLFGYYFGSSFLSKGNIFLATIAGTSLFTITSVFISLFPATPAIAIAASSSSFFLFYRAFSHIDIVNAPNTEKASWQLIFIRAIFSGSIIAIITGIATFIGPKWAGVFSAFPTTLFPMLLIIHYKHGPNTTNSIIKHVPIGLGGLLVFSISTHYAYTMLGTNNGIAIALIAAMFYLLVFLKRKYVINAFKFR